MTEADYQPKDKSNYEGDDLARSFFLPADLTMSPEEYAARNAHKWGCFSLDEYRYRDPNLGKWVKRLGEIFFTRGEVERCRLAYLSVEELARVRQEEQEPF